MEWIKVKNKKPKVNIDVLTWNGNSIRRAHVMDVHEKRLMIKVRRCEYKGLWWNDCHLFQPINDITHWMYYPEPPNKAKIRNININKIIK